jgi:P pilus assembly chaperone PapD
MHIIGSDNYKLRLSLLLVLLVIFTSPTFAQGDLLITPKRVVFDGSKRVMELNLANIGKDTARYSISLVQYRMTEDGNFEEITLPDPGQNFADKYIRFFPRTVTLGPNEVQVVKMQLTNTSNLAPGEYRSHIYFRATPKETALGEEEQNQDTTSVRIKLVPIFGITIPVIIRIGESDTKVSLSDIVLENINDTTSRLKIVFNRSGNMSVYGDLKVVHIAPDGKETVVGTANGISVYTPNQIRRFSMDIINKSNVDLHSGKLKITYSAQSDAKPEKFAEAILELH